MLNFGYPHEDVLPEEGQGWDKVWVNKSETKLRLCHYQEYTLRIQTLLICTKNKTNHSQVYFLHQVLKELII